MEQILTSLFKCRIYPSLDFTIGQNSPPRRDRSDDSATNFDVDGYWVGYRYENFIEVSTDQARIDRVLADRGYSGLTGQQFVDLFNAYEAAGEFDKAIAVANLAGESDSPMGLSDAINSHKSTRKARGTHGITSYGKRMVRSGAALLERSHGRSCLTLGTCTLPPMEPDELRRVCLEWSDLTRKFFQELQRLLTRKGLDTNYIQVTEIQEKRFDQWRQVFPHLHWVCQGRKTSRSAWSITPDEIKSLWERLLGNLLGREIDGKAATRIEMPRKSLQAELGKYLSKGSKVVDKVIEAGYADHLPSAWWGWSKSLRKQVKQEIIEDCGAIAYWLDKSLERLKAEGKIFYVPIYVTLTDPISGATREFYVGSVGRFRSMAALQEFLGYAQAA